MRMHTATWPSRRPLNGHFQVAVQNGSRACALAPSDPRYWSDLGRVYAMGGKLKDAVQCFSEAFGSMRDSPTAGTTWAPR